MFPELDLTLTEDPGRLFFAGLFFLVGFAVACRSYLRSRTVPVMPRRPLLFLSRCLSLSLLSFVLLGPVLQVRRAGTTRPSFSVLIDRSLSMELPVPVEGGETASRIERARGHIRGERLVETLQAMADVRFFVFTDRAVPVDADSILGSDPRLPAGRTDIVAAIRGSREMNPGADGLIVVTDGRINQGEDLRGLPGDDVRALFLGVDEDRGEPDVDIAWVGVSPRSYEGFPIPMTVTLRVRTEEPDTVRLTIAEDGRPIETAVAAFESGEFRRDVNLSIGSLPAGRHVLRLVAEGMESERYIENNSRHQVVSVLPSVRRALIISTTPRWDLSFLLRTMREFDYLSVDLYVLRPDGDGGVFFSDGDEITARLPAADLALVSYDLLCLQGDIADPRLAGLKDSLRSFPEPGKGILLLATEGTERTRRPENPFSAFLPVSVPDSFEIVSGRFDIVPPIRDGTGLTRSVPDLDRSLSDWSSLPPLTGLMGPTPRNDKGTAQSATLLSAKNARDQVVPVVLAEDRRGVRIVSLMGRGFWRWSFHRSHSGEGGAGYRRFIDSLIRWSFQGFGPREVRVEPARQCFLRGDPIEFRIGGPSAGEEVLVMMEPVEGNARPDTISYLAQEGYGGEGVLAVSPRPPGDYRFSYRLRDGETAGHGHVYVDSYSAEFSRPQPDNRHLEEVMLSGTGEFMSLYEMTSQELINYASFKKAETIDMATIVINRQPLIFILILILLIVEIFLRKSAGFS